MAESNQDDLLDMIFSAPINLPTVTGPDPTRKPLEHEVSSAAGSEAGDNKSQGSVDRSRQSTISSVGRRQDSEAENAENEHSHDAESDDEKDDSTIHDEHDETSDFLRYNGHLEEEDHAVRESLDRESEDGKGSELSEAEEDLHNDEEFPELKFDQQSEHSEDEHEEHEEHDEREEEQEEEEEIEEEDEDEETKPDKVAPLRTPQHDMLIGEMRMRQQQGEHMEDDEEPEGEADEIEEEEMMKTRSIPQNEYIEEDINLHEDVSDEEGKVASVSQVQYHFDSVSEKESKKSEIEKEGQKTEERAEAFLDYDRTKATVMESLDEPSFGIDMGSESNESDEESELAKFDEQAGLNTAAAMMDLLVKSDEHGEEVTKSRTLTQSSQGSQGGMRFNELSMEQHSEDRWDQAPHDFYNANVIMKKNEAYVEPAVEPEPFVAAERKESATYHAPAAVMAAPSEVPQRKISVKRDSIVSTQTGTFEQNESVAEELASAPGVRNLKSMFETGSAPQKPKLESGHPPVIQYEYEPDYRAHEERKVITSTANAVAVHSVQKPVTEPHSEATAHHEVAYEEAKPAEPIVVVRAVEEDQKPVNELMSMFGGKKAPTPKKQPEAVRKVESSRFPPRAEVERPVNIVPAVRSRASSTASVTQGTTKTDRPAKLEPSAEGHREQSPTRHTYKPPKSPMFGSEEKFQSVRVVKNVRQFVKLWGQSTYLPGGPHPMSPVPAEIPDAHEMRIVRGIEEHAVYKPTPRSRSSTVASIASAFNNGKEKPALESTHHHHEQHVEPEIVPSSAPPPPLSPASQTPPNVHHIISEKDPLNEVMIDEVPVSQRRKMFEKSQSRRQSVASNPSNPVKGSGQSGGRRVAQVKAVVRENEPVPQVEVDPKELVEKMSEPVSRDEIEKGTEEIADYISQLTPVSQRRKCFETNADPVKRNFAAPSKRIEG